VEDTVELYRGQNHPELTPKTPPNLRPLAGELLFLG
jgi:hypothetical protein